MIILGYQVVATNDGNTLPFILLTNVKIGSMLSIFDKQPLNWKDLQNKVAQIYLDMGFDVEVEKSIETVRGLVNVDVYAEIGKKAPKDIKIVECKYWNSRVPKTIVHAFRTVIADFGANAGYIVSKKGFQKGAYAAAYKSNVYLMTFNEFQDHYRENWLKSIIPKLKEIGRPLRKYADPISSLLDGELELLSKEKRDQYRQLSYKYNEISLYGIVAGYFDLTTGQLDIEYIDEIIERVVGSAFPQSIHVNCLSDYFYYLMRTFQAGLEEFDNLFGKKIRPS